MSKSNSTTRRPRTAAQSLAAEPKVDRDAALGLLHTCLATDVRVVAEIVRHVRATPAATRQLLEDVLALEAAHAAELMGILRTHRLAS